MRISVMMFCLLLGGFLTGAGEAAAQQTVTVVENLDVTGETFVYYSLRENKVVDPEEAEEDAWDIAFQSTNIRINASGQLVDKAFDALKEAPEAGYVDGEKVVPGGSGNGWYLYEPSIHAVMPIPDRLIVLKTPAGTYAKLEILSFYLNGTDPDKATEQPRYFAFRFVHQPDGSRTLN